MLPELIWQLLAVYLDPAILWQQCNPIMQCFCLCQIQYHCVYAQVMTHIVGLQPQAGVCEAASGGAYQDMKRGDWLQSLTLSSPSTEMRPHAWLAHHCEPSVLQLDPAGYCHHVRISTLLQIPVYQDRQPANMCRDWVAVSLS